MLAGVRSEGGSGRRAEKSSEGITAALGARRARAFLARLIDEVFAKQYAWQWSSGLMFAASRRLAPRSCWCVLGGLLAPLRALRGCPIVLGLPLDSLQA